MRMSKHSKWAKVKNQKGAADAKRGQIFTKLGRDISIAAREAGNDPEFNFKLRMALDRAKAANMPKDNIDRAIARGAGAGAGGELKELVYEAFGPAGSAFIITAYSDNVNRTAGEIKHILSKNNGNLAGQGAVMWQFKKMGVIRFQISNLKLQIDDLELMLVEAEAEDVKEEDGENVVFTKPEDLAKIKKIFDDQKITLESVAIEYVSKETMKLSSEDEVKAETLMDALDDNEDVSEIFTNIA